MSSWPELPPKPANDDDNRTPFRWPGPRGNGQYENWYAVVLHPEAPFALWYRYSLLQRQDGPSEARLWAIVTDEERRERQVIATQALTLDDVGLDSERFGLHLGQVGSFCNGACRGRLDSPIGPISWDLRFKPSEDTYQLIASRLANRFLLKTRHMMPNGDAIARGQVHIGDASVELNDAPMTQGHTFGPKMPSRWFWGSCPRFDGETGCSFEGLANEKGMSCQLTLDGRPYRFNTVRHIKGRAFGLLGGGTRFEAELGEVTFQVRAPDIVIDGRFSAGDKPFHQVRYLDTDGSFLFNCHQSRGALELDVTLADGRKRALRSAAGCPQEWVERKAHDRSAQDFLPMYGAD